MLPINEHKLTGYFSVFANDRYYNYLRKHIHVKKNCNGMKTRINNLSSPKAPMKYRYEKSSFYFLILSGTRLVHSFWIF